MDKESSRIITCAACGAKNRIPAERAGAQARCGRCKAELESTGQIYTLRCSACGTKNRVRSERIEEGARCGRCKEALKTEELFVPQPVIITDINFEDRVLRSPLPVLLYAWSQT